MAAFASVAQGVGGGGGVGGVSAGGGALAGTAAHCSIFGTDEFAVLYEELGGKMEAFLNSSMNVAALQVKWKIKKYCILL